MKAETSKQTICISYASKSYATHLACKGTKKKAQTQKNEQKVHFCAIFDCVWAAWSGSSFEVGERSEVGVLEDTTVSFNARA
jgi:hypothetical protein